MMKSSLCHHKQWKTMGKCGPPRKETKYITFERFWWELFQNVIFIEFEPLRQTLCAFMSSLPKPFTKYGHVTWSWLPIPKIFILRQILYQILGKVTKFGEICSGTKSYRQKKNFKPEAESKPKRNNFQKEIKEDIKSLLVTLSQLK